jgi:hypothetical protein
MISHIPLIFSSIVLIIGILLAMDNTPKITKAIVMTLIIFFIGFLFFVYF